MQFAHRHLLGDSDVSQDDASGALVEAERSIRAALRADTPSIDVERWAAWIASQPRRTDWACSDCVEMDFGSGRAGREDSVVAGFRCVWHEATARLRDSQPDRGEGAET